MLPHIIVQIIQQTFISDIWVPEQLIVAYLTFVPYYGDND